MRVGSKLSRRARSLRTAAAAAVWVLVIGGAVGYALRELRNVRERVDRAVEESFSELESRSLTRPDQEEALSRWLEAQLQPVPHLYVDIKLPDYQTLSTKRDEALEEGFLFRSEGDTVPARIRHDGKTVKVDLRLKGDLTDHLETDKWSLRVHVKKGEQLFGMRRFSLQAPETKYYHLEALFLDHLRREGLLAVRYDFVDVTVNGKHIGLMALEEHFSKELLEAQERREGVIVRYDENDFWHSFRRQKELRRRAKKDDNEGYIPKIFDNWKIARVRPFRETKVRESEVLSGHADLACSMLAGLAAETVRPSEIFNVDEIGRFLAVADLWGSWHAIRWHNLRFYLNPVSLRLEPVGFDGDVVQTWRRSPFVFKRSYFFQFLVDDAEIGRAYAASMQRLTDARELDALEDFLVEREAKYMSVLRREYPGLPAFDFATIRTKTSFRDEFHPRELEPRRDRGSRKFDDPESPAHPTAVYAHVLSEPDGARLELLNPLANGVVVDELSVEYEGASFPISTFAKIELPARLAPNFHGRTARDVTPPPRSRSWPLTGGIDWGAATIRGSAHVIGQKQRYSFVALPYQPPLEEPIHATSAALGELLVRFDFLRWDGESLATEPGRWSVPQTLNIPRTLLVARTDGPDRRVDSPGLVVTAGTHLEFAPDAYLRVAGPLQLAGTADAPVELSGADGETWKGLAVIRSPVPSRWTHATVRDTDFTEDGPWRLTGGVTFYESDVELSSCALHGAVSEDALNIIRSRFELRDVHIAGARSDAFDSDFCTGTVVDARFSDIGGDGIDLSGSTVDVQRAVFESIHDKALSVGEASTLTASDLTVRSAGVAAASKDASTAEIAGLDLEGIGFCALMAYTKKPEYGPASLSVSRIVGGGDAPRHIAQRRSTILIDGKRMFTRKVDVEALYEEGVMRK